MMDNDNKKKRISPTLAASYIAEFALCGAVGWAYEVILMYVMWHEFVNRGFLHIPVLPIYGVFAMVLLLIFRKHSNVFFVFFVSIAVTTAGELISSYIIEAVLHRQLWTYYMWPFNFQGRIALYSSLMFGVLSVLLVKAAHPLMRYFHEKLPKAAAVTGIICGIVILGDFILTLYEIYA